MAYIHEKLCLILSLKLTLIDTRKYSSKVCRWGALASHLLELVGAARIFVECRSPPRITEMSSRMKNLNTAAQKPIKTAASISATVFPILVCHQLLYQIMHRNLSEQICENFPTKTVSVMLPHHLTIHDQTG